MLSVENSSHFIQLEPSKVVTKAIRGVVEKARNALTESSQANASPVIALMMALIGVLGAAHSVKRMI